jgi:hypothetical protein
MVERQKLGVGEKALCECPEPGEICRGACGAGHGLGWPQVSDVQNSITVNLHQAGGVVDKRRSARDTVYLLDMVQDPLNV